MGRGNLQIVTFDKFALNLLRGCLIAGEREIALRPKSFEVLRYLVENSGRLIPKDELFAAVWPGVSVTDESLSRCISDVRLALEDSGQQIIKTVPRRGYIFAAPISSFLSVDRERVEAAPDFPSQCTAPDLSLVVLPFVNLSGEPAQEYLADVVTEGLTAYLSRIRGSFVIARTTAMVYKNKLSDVRRIGEELGVRYIIEGSTLPGGTRLRASARLIDAETGGHLWTEGFETSRTDLLEMEDDIVTGLARALAIELAAVVGARLANVRPHSADAEELARRAEGIFLRYGTTRDATEEGYALCEQALEIDPDNVLALGILAGKFTFRITGLQTLDQGTDLKRAEALASRALALDPNSYYARHAQSRILLVQRRFKEAIADAERTLARYPSFIPSYLDLCGGCLFLGRASQMIEWAEKAMRLSPRDPYIGAFHAYKGYGHVMLDDYDHGIDSLRNAIASNPEFPVFHARLAATLALNGQESEGRAALDRYLTHPATQTRTLAQLRAAVIESESETVVTFRERLYEGLRLLGMPEF